MRNRAASSSRGLRDRPDRTHEIYEGLLTVLMRLVFLLYAEEREMFPTDDLFVQQLFDRGPVRAAGRGRGSPSRHDGSALRRLGPLGGALPPGLRRGRSTTTGTGPIPSVWQSPRGTATCFGPTAFPSWKGEVVGRRNRTLRRSACPASRTAPSSACSATCSISMRNASAIARSKSSRSARSTRPSWDTGSRRPRAARSRSGQKSATGHRSRSTLMNCLAVAGQQAGRAVQEAHRPQAAHLRGDRIAQCPHRERPGRGARPADRPPAHAGSGAAPGRWYSSPARSGGGRDRTIRPGRSPGRS